MRLPHSSLQRRRPLRAALIAAMLCIVSLQAAAHGGGLNSAGCHQNRRTGDYHCHRAPANLPAQPAQPARPMRAASSAVPTAPPALAARPRCFTGPRGGTYTITASGRKNYGGC